MCLQLYIAVGPALCCVNCPYPETFAVLDVGTPLLIAFAPSINGSSAWDFISSFWCLWVLDGF